MKKTLLTLQLASSAITVKAQAEPFIGQIAFVAFNFAPVGWAECNGQLLPINQNQALFSLLGTMYGGNGQTTFALPDMRGRVLVHAGTGTGLSPKAQGQMGGAETHTLIIKSKMAFAVSSITSRGSMEGPALKLCFFI